MESFERMLLSKLLSQAAKKKLGCDVTIQLNDVAITSQNGKAHVHLDMDGDIDQQVLTTLLEKIGAK
jgi:hypothetical protein